jgi:hypothetical protein
MLDSCISIPEIERIANCLVEGFIGNNAFRVCLKCVKNYVYDIDLNLCQLNTIFT